MNKEALKLKVENCFQNAEKMLQDSGSLIPMLDIEFLDDKEKKCVMAVGLAVGDDKDVRDKFIKGLGLTLGAMKRIGKIKEVSCVVMMSEAWFSSVSKEEAKSGFKLPSQDQNRREMLVASGLTADVICLMRSKEMFSVEVKGKRHFTLSDIKEIVGGAEPQNVESNVLNNFFVGYKKALEDNPENRRRDEMAVLFKDASLDQLLESAVKVLTQHVGGVKSEFINKKIN